MKNLFNKYKYHLLLFIITVVLFLVNYKQGTTLSGWDNLQTELNPGLAVKRAFFSVWEEYQSMGLTAGMAHAADLPRAVFLWLMSFAIPQNMIRYFYHFLMLLMGGIGAFELVKGMDSRLRGNDPTSPSGLRGVSKEQTSEIFAFFGAVFYMLNLGTVQIFYLPFESFSTFFALLPWGIWAFLRLIRQAEPIGKNKKNLWVFLLINILGVPAFYTQQLFIVYMLVLGCVAIGSLTAAVKHGQNQVKTAAVSALFGFFLIFIINSFWILPQLYFLKTNSQVVTQAKSNQISTEEVFYQNYEKGTLGNFFRLEGFYFDLKGAHNTYLFAPWRDHFSNPIMGALPYAFGLISLIGLIGLIKKRRNIGFVLIYLLCATALLLATPPFSWINELLRKIMIVNQIFRSPFTKFIIPYSLVYSYFVAQGINYIDSRLRGNDMKEHKNDIQKTGKIEKQNFIPDLIGDPGHPAKFSLFLCVCFLVIFLYSLPAFQGYFFSPEMKVTIPSDYMQVIQYFQQQPDKNSRIALLPDYTYWGWFFNKWGYNGSGFLWYGIEQPIVSRTFDVWSKASESYFWESKTAFEAEDVSQIENVMEKYQIDYLLLDKSLIPVVSSYKALQYDRINTLLMKSANISLIFSGKNVSLYKVNHRSYSNNFISLANNLTNIGPKINITNDDQALSENGFYVNDSTGPNIYYPFLNLTSQTNITENKWKISEDANYFYISTPLAIDSKNYNIVLNTSYQETLLINNQPVNISLKIGEQIKNNQLSIKIDKIPLENFDTNIDQKTNFGFTDLNIPQNVGYIVKTISSNSQGLPLFFYIEDETKQQSYLEDRLDNPVNYFILPPRYKYGLGYNFAFQNMSYVNYPASNQVNGLTLYLFPYQILKEMKFVKKGYVGSNGSFSDNFQAEKINYFTYKVALDNGYLNHPDLILFQSYDPGWLAFSNGKILPHVIVNSWANGWRLQPTNYNLQPITIIFWPQYLEFLGFALLAIAFLSILFIKES